MIYLLALIGLVTLAVLFWKAFGPTPTTAARGGGRAVGLSVPTTTPSSCGAWTARTTAATRDRPGSDTPTDPDA